MNNLIDIHQTKEYGMFMEKIGWKVVQSRALKKKSPALNSCNIFIKKLSVLPFSVAKILGCNHLIPLPKLKELMKKYKLLFIKLQPFIIEGKNNHHYSLITNHYSLDKLPVLPTKTIWLDLTKSKDQLLKELKPKTRYNLKKAQRENLSPEPESRELKTQIISGDKISDEQLAEFYKLWKKNKPFNWLFKPSFKELKALVEGFGNKCFFVFILNSHHSSPTHFSSPNLISAVLILQSKNMSFYWHNCSSKTGKKLFAPTLACWTAILESKKRKLKVFDFGGIYDERFPRLNKGWQGFSRFKKGFGGEEIEFSKPLIYKSICHYE